MESPGRNSDVVVLGAGPAGATLAIRLAGYGYRVALIHKNDEPAGRLHHVGESLPSSARRFLSELGLSERVMRCGKTRPPRHVVCWGGPEPLDLLHEQDESRRGLYVFRDSFDAMLRQRAVEQGVLLLQGLSVVGVRLSTGHYIRVLCRSSSSSPVSIGCRFVADATGRAGVLARRWRRPQTGFRTLAVTGHFASRPRLETVIESAPSGWVWSAPLREGLRDVTLMVDSSWAQKEKTSLRGLYDVALQDAPYVSRLLGRARLVGPPRGCDATPYASRRFAGRTFILVGDAASALDPLSAHGVLKALDSASAAAVVVRTILERPGDARHAIRFYQERERSIARVTGERVASFYRQEARWAGQPFWRKRRTGAPRPAVRSSPARAPLRSDRPLRSAPGVRLEVVPVLEGDSIVCREALVGPGERRAVRFLGEVSLPEIYRAAIGAPTAGEALRLAAPGERQARAALIWLYRHGFVGQV